MTIAQTIVDQIKTIDRSALMAYGATKFINCGDGLQFNVKGLRHKGGVKITLNGEDLYEIETFRIRKLEVITKDVRLGIYAEDLVRTLDELVEGR